LLVICTGICTGSVSVVAGLSGSPAAVTVTLDCSEMSPVNFCEISLPAVGWPNSMMSVQLPAIAFALYTVICRVVAKSMPLVVIAVAR